MALADGDIVVVHDAARPLATAQLIDDVVDERVADPQADAVVAAAPGADTIKRAAADHREVAETLDRSSLWAVQTPQAFRAEALRRALDVSAGELADATDDAMLVERAGGRVIVQPAPAGNLKVTTPDDLLVAEAHLRERLAG